MWLGVDLMVEKVVVEIKSVGIPQPNSFRSTLDVSKTIKLQTRSSPQLFLHLKTESEQ